MKISEKLSPSESDFIPYGLDFGGERQKVAKEFALQFILEQVTAANCSCS